MIRVILLAVFLSGCSFVRPWVCTAPPAHLMEPLEPLPLLEGDRPDGSMSMPGFYEACGMDVIRLKDCRAIVEQFQRWYR